MNLGPFLVHYWEKERYSGNDIAAEIGCSTEIEVNNENRLADAAVSSVVASKSNSQPKWTIKGRVASNVRILQYEHDQMRKYMEYCSVCTIRAAATIRIF